MKSTLINLIGCKRIIGGTSGKEQEDSTTLLGVSGEGGLRLETFDHLPEDVMLKDKH